jgi:hypothetical protein
MIAWHVARVRDEGRGGLVGVEVIVGSYAFCMLHYKEIGKCKIA